jgi:hypothetical protein
MGRARYATFSALLHIIIIIIGGSAVIIKNIVEPPDFMAEPGSLISSDTTIAPPEQTPQMQQNAFTPTAPSASPSAAAPTLMAIATNNPSANTFKLDAMPTPQVQVKADALSKSNAPPSPNLGTELSKEIAGKIAGFTGRWAKGGTGSIGQPLKMDWNKDGKPDLLLRKYGIGRRCQSDLVAELVEALGQAGDEFGGVTALVVVGAEILPAHAAHQHVVDAHQDAAGHGDARPLLAPAWREPRVERVQVAA